jgi:plastocyanin
VNNKVFLGSVGLVVIVIAAIAFYFVTKPIIAATITYTDSGFSPKETTVKAGSTVRVVNESGHPLRFASGPHPEHNLNAELNMSELAKGKDGTIRVTREGKWSFHNHLNDDHSGIITVIK